MAGSILDLYRSALPNPRADWTDGWQPTRGRGLVIHAADDPFGDLRLSREIADVLGAGHETLPGCGHWWMLQAPERAAAVLRSHLASAD